MPIALILGILSVLVIGSLVYRQISSRKLIQQNLVSVPAQSTPPSPSATPTPTLKIASPKPSQSPKTTPTPQPTSSGSPYTYNCEITPKPAEGNGPLLVHFDYGSAIPPGANTTIKEVQWDYNGDGVWDTEFEGPKSFTYIYSSPGTYTVKMRTKMSNGVISNICSSQVKIAEPNVVCEVHSNVTSGLVPLIVNFYYGAASYGGDLGYVTDVQWDFDGDGTWDTPFDVSSQRPSHTYDKPNIYVVRMQLKTSKGYTSNVCTEDVVATL